MVMRNLLIIVFVFLISTILIKADTYIDMGAVQKTAIDIGAVQRESTTTFDVDGITTSGVDGITPVSIDGI